jgi:Tol biopolymer transport system component
VIGTRLGRYRITASIGAGGMGEVYRARDEALGRDVALKILPSEIASDPLRLARFEREAKLLASLNHPNIASIYGFEEADTGRFLVLELVEGEDLSERLERGAVPVGEAIPIARQIAEALEQAHEKDIVHRDLKPGNVKLTPDGRVKVLDFGLAKAWTADPGSGSAPDISQSPTLAQTGTQAGVILGTAPYMSPEQARGKPVDKRADVWAFGAVLFEMLTGRRLFAGETVTDVLAAVLTTEIPLGTLPAATPPPVRRLLRRCLERNPKDRLHDIADARIVLDEVLSGRGEEAGAAAPGSGRRTALALAAVPVAAVLGGLLVLFARPDRPAPEPARIRRLTFSGHDRQPSVSPDGRFVAFASSRDGVSRIWLKQMEGGGEQRLTEGPDFLPRFAPDGNSVGFLRESRPGRYDLCRTALVGGQPRRLVANVSDFDWSPDGGSVAFTREPKEDGGEDVSSLRVVDLETVGRERTLLEVEGRLLLGPRWRPDGGRSAVTRGDTVAASGGWKLLLVDPVTGASEDLGAVDGPGMISGSAWDRRGTGLLYAASPNTIGDFTGAPAAVRLLVPGASPKTLFWASGLFPLSGFSAFPTVFSILGPNRLVFEALEQSQELREVDLVERATRQLTRTLALDRQPVYSPDGRLVVFSSTRSGNLDLWVLDRGSGALRQLTDDAAQDWDPGFSADGRRVLFSSSRGGHLEIWSIDLDGSNARQLSADGVDAENPTVTPDGRWLVYSSGNPAHLGLVRMRPDGSEAARITTGVHATPEVSPDGRWALFVSTTGLVAGVRFVEIETGRLAPAAIDLGSTLRAASITLGRGRWTRKGAAVAFMGIDDRGRTGVFEQDFDPERNTAATRRPLAGFFDDVQTESFGIAPDGSSVTLAVIRETHSLMLADGLPEGPP